jgi:hypothetical protein
MKVSLFMRRAVVLTKRGIKVEKSYYLPDMAYGQFLVYDQTKPVYYIDFFDRQYKELKQYLEANNMNAEALLTKLLRINGQKKLSVKEQCWWRYRFKKEISVQYEVDPFPVSYWDNGKQML